MYRHILVFADGSELAQKGVDHGLKLAKCLGSKITIITVTEPFPRTAAGAVAGWVPAPIDYDRYAAGQSESAERVLAEAKAAAEKMGIKANAVHVSNAWPASAIVGTAQSRACDLIIVASHSWRGVQKVLLGSQTTEVLATSPVPVLVVKTGTKHLRAGSR